MFTTIWAWIKGLFTAKKLGIILAIFAKQAASVMIKEIMDPVNQQKAYDFVKELRARTDLSNREKAEVFNLQMLDWAKKLGKKLSTSMINCLREMAVAALKAEQPCAEAKEIEQKA